MDSLYRTAFRIPGETVAMESIDKLPGNSLYDSIPDPVGGARRFSKSNGGRQSDQVAKPGVGAAISNFGNMRVN